MRKTNFQWNPFSILGEAPGTYRFKTNFGDGGEGDLEFATKEDLEVIEANPQLKKVHQAMLSGVNKKFQEWASDRKQLQQAVESLNSKVRELDGGLSEWEEWFTNNKDSLMNLGKPDDGNQPKNQRGGREREGGDEGVLEKRFNQLVQTFNQAGSRIEQRIGHMGKMLSLSMQLNDLYRKNPEMDGEKVLDTALKSGITDLSRAYQDTYHDDILNKQVEERLKPRIDEEMAKRTTQVETGSGAVPLTFETLKQSPKSWNEAGQQFLEERAKEEAKP